MHRYRKPLDLPAKFVNGFEHALGGFSAMGNSDFFGKTEAPGENPPAIYIS